MLAKDLRKGDVIANGDDIRKVKRIRRVDDKVEIEFENTDPANIAVVTYRMSATTEIVLLHR